MSGAELCAGCGKPLSGLVTSVGDKKYHPDCFKCSFCPKKLQGGYAKVGDKFACTTCAKTKAATVSRAAAKGHDGAELLCKDCGKPMSGKRINATAGAMFHPECFLCANSDCRQSLTRGFVKQGDTVEGTDRFVCVDCGNRPEPATAGKPCTICGTVWPHGTFWCTKCQAPTSHPKGEMKCLICNKKVDSGKDMALDAHTVFHPECFRCNKCGKMAIERGSTVQLQFAAQRLYACKRGEYKCSTCRGTR